MPPVTTGPRHFPVVRSCPCHLPASCAIVFLPIFPCVSDHESTSWCWGEGGGDLFQAVLWMFSSPLKMGTAYETEFRLWCPVWSNHTFWLFLFFFLTCVKETESMWRPALDRLASQLTGWLLAVQIAWRDRKTGHSGGHYWVLPVDDSLSDRDRISCQVTTEADSLSWKFYFFVGLFIWVQFKTLYGCCSVRHTDGIVSVMLFWWHAQGR